MQSDLDRWLSAIRAHPAEDAVRLEFADWLQERSATADGWRECPKRPPDNTCGLGLNGCGKPCPVCHGANRISNRYSEWAEFVRVQVELANWRSSTCDTNICRNSWAGRKCQTCRRLDDLRSRERELWPLVRERFAGEGWTVELDEPDCGNCGACHRHLSRINSQCPARKAELSPLVIVRRGFPAVVRGRLEALTGGECENCAGFGEFRRRHDNGDGPEGPCPECGGKWNSGPHDDSDNYWDVGSGRTPGVLAKLAAWPVERVEVTNEDEVIYRCNLDSPKFGVSVPGLHDASPQPWPAELFDSIEDAREFLSDAILSKFHREPQARRITT